MWWYYNIMKNIIILGCNSDNNWGVRCEYLCCSFNTNHMGQLLVKTGILLLYITQPWSLNMSNAPCRWRQRAFHMVLKLQG